LIKLLQKFAGAWGSAPRRARRREILNSPFQFAQRITGSFSCGYKAKKKNEKSLLNVKE